MGSRGRIRLLYAKYDRSYPYSRAVLLDNMDNPEIMLKDFLPSQSQSGR